MTSCHTSSHPSTPPARRHPIAVLIKQVPKVAETPVGPDGRLARDTAPAEINPHCRRALAKGVELAAQLGTTCTVITLGPPRAADVLVEALGFGADRAVLLTDPQLAGADTLATARALAAALARTGPYELVLTGRNSVDSDTGQVGPQLAELAGLAFVGPVRELHVHGATIAVRSELDAGWRESEVPFPVLVSCAERLCAPAKLPDPPAHLRGRVETLTAADLGPGPWGQAGSPTFVAQVTEQPPSGHVVVARELSPEVLDELLARAASSVPTGMDPVPEPAGANRVVAVLAEPGRAALTRELLGGAAALGIGRVVGLGPDLDPELASTWGADEAVLIDAAAESAVAAAVASWCGWRVPSVVLAPGTSWGREVAGRVAARLGAGLTGDAIGVEWADGLVCRKAVSGGSRVAAIRYRSLVQLATVRAGVFPLRIPRTVRAVPALRLASPDPQPVYHVEHTTDAQIDALGGAHVVVGVGAGVAAADIALVETLCRALGAELVATRKVTDAGVVPHYRQVGITGRSIAPDVYLALGVSGKANHVLGVRRARFVAAVNTDPHAPVFERADLGIVADWRDVARALIERTALVEEAVS